MPDATNADLERRIVGTAMSKNTLVNIAIDWFLKRKGEDMPVPTPRTTNDKIAIAMTQQTYSERHEFAKWLSDAILELKGDTGEADVSEDEMASLIDNWCSEVLSA